MAPAVKASGARSSRTNSLHLNTTSRTQSAWRTLDPIPTAVSSSSLLPIKRLGLIKSTPSSAEQSRVSTSCIGLRIVKSTRKSRKKILRSSAFRSRSASAIKISRNAQTSYSNPVHDSSVMHHHQSVIRGCA